MIKLKRAYDPPSPDDGVRILVDRIWPRGVKKDDLALDRWEKELAPSSDLRGWFGHDPARWDEFQARYRQELTAPPLQPALDRIAEQARQDTVTLVYGARDTEHNQAVALKAYLDEHA